MRSHCIQTLFNWAQCNTRNAHLLRVVSGFGFSSKAPFRFVVDSDRWVKDLYPLIVCASILNPPIVLSQPDIRSDLPSYILGCEVHDMFEHEISFPPTTISSCRTRNHISFFILFRYSIPLRMANRGMFGIVQEVISSPPNLSRNRNYQIVSLVCDYTRHLSLIHISEPTRPY